MKKIWPYIATFFIGLSAGIMIGVKWLGEKTVFKGNVRIKQRGRGNIQKPDLDVNLPIQTKRGDRSQDRIARRNERRMKKDLTGLEKST